MENATQTPEFVKIEESDFTCICGNSSMRQGGYYCDGEGHEIEAPPNDDEPGFRVCCDNCGRIFDSQTGLVFKRATWTRHYKP